MRWSAVAFVSVLAAAPIPAFAQQAARPAAIPRVELAITFGVRSDPSTDQVRLIAPASNGRLSADVTLSRRTALVIAAPSVAVPANGPVEYSWLAGTRHRFGDSTRWMPFAELLFGAAKGRVAPPGQIPPPGDGSHRTAFQFAVSGGLDVRITDRLLIRAVQVEDQRIAGTGGYQTLAATTGVVVRFGERRP
jgi:hypothetical protein